MPCIERQQFAVLMFWKWKFLAVLQRSLVGKAEEKRIIKSLIVKLDYFCCFWKGCTARNMFSREWCKTQMNISLLTKISIKYRKWKENSKWKTFSPFPWGLVIQRDPGAPSRLLKPNLGSSLWSLSHRNGHLHTLSTSSPQDYISAIKHNFQLPSYLASPSRNKNNTSHSSQIDYN